MSKLTAAQRLTRPLINYLVERFFPNGMFFYGRGPLTAFDRIDVERKSAMGTMAALALARNAMESKTESISVDIEGMTVNGGPVGDWRVTVERIGGKS